jgi:hypothetical protein
VGGVQVTGGLLSNKTRQKTKVKRQKCKDKSCKKVQRRNGSMVQWQNKTKIKRKKRNPHNADLNVTRKCECEY